MKRSVNILVIDDEEVVIQGVQKILRHDSNYNYTVDFAYSAEQGLEKTLVTDFDIIISDIVMPGMDGMELLQILMDKDITAQVIMFTGYATMKTALLALKMGAFDFIAKPFTSDELFGSIHHSLNTKSKRSENKIDSLKDKNVIKPSQIYSIPGHTWAKIRDDYAAFIGIEKNFLDSIGKIKDIELSKKGELIIQGYGFGNIITKNKIGYKLPSPLSGRIIAVNTELIGNHAQIYEYPKYDGWLIHIEPTELEKEISNLILSV